VRKGSSRRRGRQEEHENHERWLVSYADFITLLFAFFVVMYSISSVNEGKYRVLSETMSTVFNVVPTSDEPIQVGERPRDLLPSPLAPLTPRRNTAAESTESEKTESAAGKGLGTRGEEDTEADGMATRIADEIAISLQDYVDKDLMRINRVGDRIEIEMKERMLFPSGRARLSRSALQALRQISKTLARIPAHLQIEGHTDNVPISTAEFPSNWELSAARAASVVHFLARAGIDAERMAAVGRGEHRPIAENTDAKGRATNRRVTIVVLTGQRINEVTSEQEVPWAEGPAVELR